MARKIPLNISVNDAEQEALLKMYGAGRSGSAKMRHALLHPRTHISHADAERIVRSMEKVWAELIAITSKLDQNGDAEKAESAAIFALLLAIWETTKDYAVTTFSPK